MKYKFTIALLFITTLSVRAQQNVQFSQYVFNGLTLNPAYAGYKEDWYIQGSYRQQWTGFPGAPKTTSLSFDGLTRAENKNVGIGGQFLTETLGPQKSISLYADYAYRIQLDEADTRRICFGIAAGASQYTLDGTMLDPKDLNDENIPVGNVNTWVPDARFGVYYYSPKWYAGVSLLDLFSLNADRKLYYSRGQQYVSLQRATHLYFTSGMVFNISDNVKLKPSFLIKEDFRGPTSVDLNVFALLANQLWIGGSYRTSAKLWNKKNLEEGLTTTVAASMMAEYYVNDKFRIGYSYDIATNGLAGYQGGSHEFSVGYLIPGKRNYEKIVSPRYF